ncbi:uncharacterized protein LOC131891672 [Tigriopus californicus]|uniref:uncharacterized protein LOC131891672 n=1 Tax=Tigriopus californicus TaxID=6832 RepID=UPI0027DA210D|nr:uncharacterized protein LOC131891672 [Tigriopus californicus]
MSIYDKLLLIILFIGVGAVSAHRFNSLTNDTDREGKLLSLFQIVRFPNEPCVAAASKNGTCYTSDECTSKGGTKSGSCAQGYGVCCTFTATCGATSSENCTYFESGGVDAGSCKLEICPCGGNICQLRLDFDQFLIAGPSTSLVAVSNHKEGVVGAAAATKPVTLASRCLTDTFSVTSPTGQSPPSICGINTGEHMYVDSTSACNELVFQLGSNSAVRQWSIKVTQYSCGYPNLAPDGCTQYFFGSNADTIQTYNFAGGQHLANQDQNICIRRERGNCRICYSADLPTDFMTSGKELKAIGKPSECCAYGATGAGSQFDCLIIPGALNPTMLSKQGMFDEFCGRSAGIQNTGESVGADLNKTVCSARQPFSVRFLSDSFEVEEEIGFGPMVGFKLSYLQTSGGC